MDIVFDYNQPEFLDFSKGFLTQLTTTPFDFCITDNVKLPSLRFFVTPNLNPWGVLITPLERSLPDRDNFVVPINLRVLSTWGPNRCRRHLRCGPYFVGEICLQTVGFGLLVCIKGRFAWLYESWFFFSRFAWAYGSCFFRISRVSACWLVYKGVFPWVYELWFFANKMGGGVGWIL